MTSAEAAARRQAAIAELERHPHRSDGTEIVTNLYAGLGVLRDLLYVRVRADVERRLGADSMLSPVSEEKTVRVTKTEIELYQIAMSAATAGQHDYIGHNGAGEWYLQWLTQFRLGELCGDVRAMNRLHNYLAKDDDARRLAFTNVLASAVPQSRRAPLVLFRLLPLAVAIVTALAFGDEAAAQEARRRQIAILPSITDCPLCRGTVLDSGDQCEYCGNPLWKFDWLLAVD
jgi:hypothetical protein